MYRRIHTVLEATFRLAHRHALVAVLAATMVAALPAPSACADAGPDPDLHAAAATLRARLAGVEREHERVADAVSRWLEARRAAIEQDDLVKLRKQMRELERKQEKFKKSIAKLEAELDRVKKRMARRHGKAFDFATQKKVAGEIAAWMNANPTEGSADKVYAAIEKTLVSEFGREIVAVTRDLMIDQIAAIMEETAKSKEQVTINRVGRSLKETFTQELDEDYDVAFDRKLKQKTRLWDQILSEKKELKKASLELERVRRLQTATISARIPTGMIPVPAASNVALGTVPDQIISVSNDLKDPTKRNSLLLWATPTLTKSVAEFMIDQFEVTHLAYWYFCTQTGHRMPQFLAGYDELPGGKKKPIWKDLWPDGKVPKIMERLPITWVNREDARAYCRWTQTRLPTEEEWEVAARSGPNGFDGRFWPWGDYEKQVCCDATTIDHPARKKLVAELPKDILLPGAVPVGTFEQGRTPLGIYDMAGSVAEWTASPFVAYPGFTGKMHCKVDGEIHCANEFNERKVVVRGGHCGNRDVAVSSIFRTPIKHEGARLRFVGFRRVRSGIAGKDQLRYLMRNGRLDARLQDFKLTRGDEKRKWIFPHLDTREEHYAILERFDWNEELQVPGKGSKIIIANRFTDELVSSAYAKKFSKGENDVPDSLLIGMLHTDVELMDPPLTAGTWFVSFKRGYSYRDKETRKKIKVKDRFLFVPFKTDGLTLGVDAGGSEIAAYSKKAAATYKTQLSPIVIEGDGDYDKLRAEWVFEIGRTGKKSVVELDFKVKKGVIEAFQ